ncbi:BCAS3 domain-containing protein [Forsythia ovata]|uniref:BCAS3 domain-containing protein n=1 Tax=Forsythia ovata TaxID=205694 RepID=A0ABD1PPT5_9LAMI
MPFHMRSESGCHDWSTSYVHLYKLHRGITTAVIQDICFSHDNQWIAIVSSKGTCHIFVISPFGGDTGIQALHSHIQGSILYPDSSPPWWPTSSFALNEKCSSPPPPCTLSVSLVQPLVTGAETIFRTLWVALSPPVRTLQLALLQFATDQFTTNSRAVGEISPSWSGPLPILKNPALNTFCNLLSNWGESTQLLIANSAGFQVKYVHCDSLRLIQSLQTDFSMASNAAFLLDIVALL